MSRYERSDQGPKTKNRQREILEGGGRHDDPEVGPEEPIPDSKAVDTMTSAEKRRNLDGKAGRQSEFPVSRGGMNQESRQHNKP